MRRNKPFGFEVIQLRLNGLSGRYREIAVRISELNRGTRSSIEELDESAPEEHGGGTGLSTYQFFASGSVII